MLVEMDSELFCARLKEIRKQRKLTQQELAEKSGIPSTSISHIEAGSRKPSLENFYKLIVVLNVSADYLLGRTKQYSDLGTDSISKSIQELPELEREMIERFILSLQK
ncbi:helix-turn-helix domain-containing protein [Acinetobacter pittii]|uniref:helix-turn-helix domain-containing protein n=1 Tax=Acinetobacter pittii TaxID=48296 RepID=UPI0005EB8DE6|nr:helix-turn-helix transcriptional regulator [Acinetobacter pittii]RZH38816.1 XRE family transcriptional regulator [Acinetobacter pittii]